MKYLNVICLLPVLFITTSLPLRAQGEPKARGILHAAVELAAEAEPEWDFGFDSCTCDRPRGERGSALGHWVRETAGVEEEISVSVVEMESDEDAARRFDRSPHMKQDGGVRRYKSADDAYLLEHPDRNSTSLYFRKGKILVVVEGSAVSDVERFGELLLAAVAAT